MLVNEAYCGHHMRLCVKEAYIVLVKEAYCVSGFRFWTLHAFVVCRQRWLLERLTYYRMRSL